MITYRWIEGATASEEEWQRIDDILAFKGWPSLNRATTLRIRIAEEDSRIIGFITLQLFPHAEPLYVIPRHRGTGIAQQLADDMVEFMKEVNCRGFELTADSQFAVKMAEDRGLKRVESPVYRTVVSQ